MKQKIFTLCLALIIALVYGCKKNDTKESFSNIPQTGNEKIKAWLETQPGFVNYQEVLVDGKSIKVPEKIDWENSKYFSESKTNITPVVIESVNENLPTLKYLVTIMDAEGDVVSGNYYTVLADKKTSASSQSKMVTPELFNMQKTPTDFTGAINKYDLENKILMSKHFDLGVPANKTDVLAVKKSKSQIPIENYEELPEGCSYITIEWYYQVWENGVLIYEEYIGSSTIVVCEGGNNGGGGGSGGPCNMTVAEAQQQLNAITIERFYSSQCTAPIIPSQFTTWPIISPRTCSTGVATLHFFGGYYASYTAFFNGSIKKEGPNEPWKWLTFGYNTTTLTNGGIPPCFTLDKSVAVNPTISQDKLTAYAQVNYTFTAKVFCLNGWQPSPPLNGAFTQNFDSN